MSQYQGFTELAVWKKAREFKNKIKSLADSFPNDERFRLADQIIRSSRSINANVAEGHGRYTYKDQIRFCIQARGSLTETHNHLIDALDCRYITEEIYLEFKNQIIEVEKHTQWLHYMAERQALTLTYLVNLSTY